MLGSLEVPECARNHLAALRGEQGRTELNPVVTPLAIGARSSPWTILRTVGTVGEEEDCCEGCSLHVRGK